MDYSKIPTPSFVLDEKRLRENLKLIAEVQEMAGIKIILAFKGFAMWSTFPLIREYIDGASASSLYEARLCYEEMNALAHTYSPVYIEKEFDEIVKYSSHIVFNSINQYEKLIGKIKSADHHVSCGLRINPEYSDVSVNLYNPSADGSRLGIGSHEFPEEIPDDIEGLHFHVLCESNSYSLERVLKNLEKNFKKHLEKIKWINMGGGHLITDKEYDRNHLIDLLKAFRRKYSVDIILEPGSAFAWNTGVLVSSVEDIVIHKGVKTAILDVSFTAHMPDTLEMPYRPKIVGATEPDGSSDLLYRLGGLSCLAGDYMEVYQFDKPLNIGDKIIFYDMIHYTMVKTTMFNGVNHPHIAVWTENSEFKIMKKFEYEDFKNRLS